MKHKYPKYNLFRRDDGQIKKLIISAHGGHLNGDRKVVVPGKINIYHTSAYNWSARVQVDDVVEFFVHKKPWPSSCTVQHSIQPVPTKVTNYRLEKYAKTKGLKGESDTYARYLWISDQYDIDIASPRKGQNCDLNNVINGVNNPVNVKRYDAIIYSFCLTKIE